MAGIHNALAGSGDGYISLALTISSNTSNYVLDTSKVAGYVPGRTRLTLTVASGVQISSASAASPAFRVDSSWQPGDLIEVVNNGSIGGAGGAGGAGSAPQGDSVMIGSPTPPAAASGSPGGSGLEVQFPTSVRNNGTIGGGGGGGGGSRGWNEGSGSYILYGGYPGGTGGTIFTAAEQGYSCYADTPGHRLWPAKRYITHFSGGGGPAGQGGQAGEDNSSAPSGAPHGAGGAAGAAVVGNSNITWLATGTRIGPIT